MKSSLKKQLLSLLFIFGCTLSHAQLLSVGYKQNKKGMFHASFNYPVFFAEKRPYDISLGFDFTSKNRSFPSGLMPQLTGIYYIVDDKYKEYLIYAGLSTGYLFDFNKNFDNQFHVSPHLYFEFEAFLNLKVGYDISTPLKKGYPYFSIGLGGFHLFRHFTIM